MSAIDFQLFDIFACLSDSICEIEISFDLVLWLFDFFMCEWFVGLFVMGLLPVFFGCFFVCVRMSHVKSEKNKHFTA